MSLINDIERYTPFNEQEQTDKQELIRLLKTEKNIFLRDNLAHHMTSSAWVTDPERTKVLMAYHNIYNSWSWLGGHADGDEDLLAVAKREIEEESGIQNPVPCSKDIFSLEILTVDGHEKRGRYVPSHLHLNVTYLFEADPSLPLLTKPDENSAVAWFPIEESIAASSEEWFRERIYSKLNEKLKKLRVV